MLCSWRTWPAPTLVPSMLPMHTESTANIPRHPSRSYNPRPTNDLDWTYTLRIEHPSTFLTPLIINLTAHQYERHDTASSVALSPPVTWQSALPLLIISILLPALQYLYMSVFGILKFLSGTVTTTILYLYTSATPSHYVGSFLQETGLCRQSPRADELDPMSDLR